jgi:hypothetical protein
LSLRQPRCLFVDSIRAPASGARSLSLETDVAVPTGTAWRRHDLSPTQFFATTDQTHFSPTSGTLLPLLTTLFMVEQGAWIESVAQAENGTEVASSRIAQRSKYGSPLRLLQPPKRRVLV